MGTPERPRMLIFMMNVHISSDRTIEKFRTSPPTAGKKLQRFSFDPSETPIGLRIIERNL